MYMFMYVDEDGKMAAWFRFLVSEAPIKVSIGMSSVSGVGE